MIDRPFEDLLTAWYRSRAEAEPLPERLRTRVLALPQRRPASAFSLGGLNWSPRPALVLIALLAALTLAFAAMAAGLAPRLFPDRTQAFPANLDACAVLRAAVNPRQLPGWRESDHPMTAWGAHVCAYDRWDSDYSWKHLFLRTQPTTLAEATALINDQSNWSTRKEERGEFAAPLPAIWRPISAGVWAGIAAADAERDTGMDALAVSREPYFFIVTSRWESQVLEDARLVADELGVSIADVPGVYEWPPFVVPVPTMWRP